jgi:hypothetical protein
MMLLESYARRVRAHALTTGILFQHEPGSDHAMLLEALTARADFCRSHTLTENQENA